MSAFPYYDYFLAETMGELRDMVNTFLVANPGWTCAGGPVLHEGFRLQAVCNRGSFIGVGAAQESE